MNTYIRPASNERHSISASDLLVLLREAEVAAARVVRRFQIPAWDRDDLHQDILVDLLGRLTAFDPKRGTFGAFVGTIAGHRAARLTHRIRRRLAMSSMVSLDEPQIANGAMAEGDGSSASLGQPFDYSVEIEQRLDLVRALSRLGPAEVSLCAKLAEYSPTEISRTGEYSRATLYRRLTKIRLRLVTQGISWP